jgi:hypothetical protein
MTDERPKVDDRHPADAIDDMVRHVLGLAETWTSWDGTPRSSGGRAFAPHKAIRRVTDHMIDHLAQLQAHVAGIEPPPDRWHGSTTTTANDLAPFQREDADEARSRLERLALLWRLALAEVPLGDLDRAHGDAYTPREMAFCAAASVEYADAVGDLAVRSSS